MRQGLHAGSAVAVRQPALDEIGRDGAVPVDGKLVRVVAHGLVRVRVRAENGSVENLAGIIRRQRVERGLAGGQNFLGHRIVRALHQQGLPLLARLHRRALGGSVLDAANPGVRQRDVAVLERARNRRVRDDGVAIRRDRASAKSQQPAKSSHAEVD